MKIKITEVFTDTPGGRLSTDGDFSGEEFRLRILSPLLFNCLRTGDSLVIDLNGTSSYSSEFLEESFGGLVRMGYLYSDVISCLRFISEDRQIERDIKTYILKAGKIQIEKLRKGRNK